MMDPKHPAEVRRHELDWLRILAILAVFVYHSLRFFNAEDWHLKNAFLHPGLDPFMKFFTIWGMPLLFTISGAGVFYSLGKKGAGEFLKNRARRLLVPLCLGVFTHGIWQVYIERSSHGQFAGSFLQFIPRYFDGLYGLGGNFAWMGLHLWYLEVLFVFCAVLLPVLIWLRKTPGKSGLLILGRIFSFPGGAYFLAIPIMSVSLLRPEAILTARVFGGWSVAAYVLFFINGFLIVSNNRLYENIRTTRWISLGAALGVTIPISAAYIRLGEPLFGTPYYTALISAFGLCAWLWVVTLLGFASQHLQFSSRLQILSNEAVLPFYILHQPLLLAFGTLLIRGPLPDAVKWAFIFVAAFSGSVGLHEFVIRGSRFLRFLFGLPGRSDYPSKPVWGTIAGFAPVRRSAKTPPARIELPKHSL